VGALINPEVTEKKTALSARLYPISRGGGRTRVFVSYTLLRKAKRRFRLGSSAREKGSSGRERTILMRGKATIASSWAEHIVQQDA